MADDVTLYDAVEAYCGRLSYVAGETATLHVSARAERYRVEVARAGISPTVVWSLDNVTGVHHPAPPSADSQGCDWPVGVEIPVGNDWPSGFYIVTLTAADAPLDRAVGYAAFIVRPAALAPDTQRPSGRALLVVATNTFHAYNNWGGVSLYTGGKQVSFRRPFGRGLIARPLMNPNQPGRDPATLVFEERDDRKARPVHTGEEPDVSGDLYQQFRWANGLPGYMSSAGWFTYERRFAEWAAREGFEFDVAASSDLACHPEVIDGYGLVLSIGHDEYWSAGQRSTIEAHIARGGHLASFSGNTCFWQVRLTLDADGEPDGYVCRKYSAHLDDPVLGTPEEHTMSGMWADPVVGNPEWKFLGAGSAYGLYSRFGLSMPRGAGAFTVYRHDHWMLEGTGLGYGELLGRDDGVVGYETVGTRITLDEYQLPIPRGGDGTPDDTVIVAYTPSTNLGMGDYPASIAALSDQGDLEFIASRVFGGLDPGSLAKARYGNSVMLVTRPFGEAGGEVVTIGSTDWIYGLNDPAVSQVTRNVLSRYVR
jgi:hypothetical protein